MKTFKIPREDSAYICIPILKDGVPMDSSTATDAQIGLSGQSMATTLTAEGMGYSGIVAKIEGVPCGSYVFTAYCTDSTGEELSTACMVEIVHYDSQVNVKPTTYKTLPCYILTCAREDIHQKGLELRMESLESDMTKVTALAEANIPSRTAALETGLETANTNISKKAGVVDLAEVINCACATAENVQPCSCCTLPTLKAVFIYTGTDGEIEKPLWRVAKITDQKGYTDGYYIIFHVVLNERYIMFSLDTLKLIGVYKKEGTTTIPDFIVEAFLDGMISRSELDDVDADDVNDIFESTGAAVPMTPEERNQYLAEMDAVKADADAAAASAATAVTTANEAKTAANEAKTIANAAAADAATALTTATEAKTLATTADTSAATALTTATEAKTLATTADANATTAKSEADEALSKIGTAEADALEAKEKATEAQTGKITRSSDYGKGYITLAGSSTKTSIEQSDFPDTNTIYEIQGDFTLDGTIVVPADSVIKFNGGSITGGSIYFNETFIDGDPQFINCACNGHLTNKTVTPEMFGVPEANEDGQYDISAAIQRAFNGGNKNIYIAEKNYLWTNTLVIPCKVADGTGVGGSTYPSNAAKIHLFGDFTTKQAYYKSTETWKNIMVTASIAIQFKDWDADHAGFLHMNNLNFTFNWQEFNYKDSDGNIIHNNFIDDSSIFIDGWLYGSFLNDVGVKYAGTIFHGGLTKVSKVTNCVFTGIRKACIMGDIWDSTFENNYVNGCGCGYTTKNSSGCYVPTAPAFYIPMRPAYADKTKYTTGCPNATTFNANYIEYFDTIFWRYPSQKWEDLIKSSNNYYDIFKFWTRGFGVKFDSAGVYIDLTQGITSVSTAGKILSKNDIIMRCNNVSGGTFSGVSSSKFTDPVTGETGYFEYNVTNGNSQSTKYQLLAHPDDLTEGTYDETFSLFYGGAPNTGYVDIDSYIDKDTVDYIIICGTEDDKQELALTNACTDWVNYNKESRIKGGHPDQYCFSHISQKAIPIELPDLQDITYTEKPTSELFNGRRIIFNGIANIYYYASANTDGGWFVNREAVYTQYKADMNDFLLGSANIPSSKYLDPRKDYYSILGVLVADGVGYTLDDSDNNKYYNRRYAFNKIAIQGPVTIEVPDDSYEIRQVMYYDSPDYTSAIARQETTENVIVPIVTERDSEGQATAWTRLKSYTYTGNKYIRVVIGKKSDTTFIDTTVTPESGLLDDVTFKPYLTYNLTEICDIFKEDIATINSKFGSGATADRPTSPVAGYEYYDSDLKKKILWNGSEWVNIDGTALV